MSKADSPDAPTDLCECASALSTCPTVVAVDVLDDDPRLDGPCLECVVGPDAEAVPPGVLRCLARHDRGIHSVDTRGEPMHRVVVVR